MPTNAPRIRAVPHGSFTERDDLAHDDLSVVVDEELDEAAVPAVAG